MKDLNIAAVIALAGFIAFGAIEATMKDPWWLLSLAPGLLVYMAARTWCRSKERSK